MIERTNPLLRPCVLVIDDKLALPSTVGGRAIRELVEELENRKIKVIEAPTIDDGEAVIASDSSVNCVFLDWTTGAAGSNDPESHAEAECLLRSIRSRRELVPVFLMADRSRNHTPGVQTMQMSNEFVWMLEDTAPFIVDRALHAIKRYMENLLPPFTKALLEYTAIGEHSWAAPGHQGGVAFTKTPEGRVFFDTFGENLFRNDMGIERTALGSLLDHEGAIGEAEKFAARVFGAHRSYSGVNGTSGSNRTILAAMVADGDIALCDRNCHKSIEQGLILSGGIPVFFLPTRNRYGIIGPIPPEEFSRERIREKIAANPLCQNAAGERPVYAVVTNCTYDGMCYDAAGVERLLAETVDVIHFDEAWYAYARFHPIYHNRFAMRGDPFEHPESAPTIFSTQSTHKLLAALSQASWIHLRNGRRPVIDSHFNEAYMAQTTTSPLYPLIASNEIGAAMMNRGHGRTLIREVLSEAIDFRQAMARAHREFAEAGDWFFQPWNAPEVRDPATGKNWHFADAPQELLLNEPDCWILRPEEIWHGFQNLPDGWCMLDPLKVGILSPGMEDDGSLGTFGIPAEVLTAYLSELGIVPSRTTDFMVLCLFSVGITKGKWGTLMNSLLGFKQAFDENAALEEVLPALSRKTHPRFEDFGLQDLCREMLEFMREHSMDSHQAAAFANLPGSALPPRVANAKLLSGAVDLLPLSEMAQRVIAVGAIPYPPGIPILMPGESAGPADGPWLTYLRTLELWNARFPGFEKIVEGAVLQDNAFHFWCVRE